MQRDSKIIGNHARIFPSGSATKTVHATATRARNTNVATIVTGTAHGLTTGQTVDITLMTDSSYDGTAKVVTVTNGTTFTYASTGTDESTTADLAGVVTHTTGTASKTAKPTPTDPGWVDVGILSELSFDRSMTEDQVFAPNPGRIELSRILETKQILGIKFTSDEISPKLVEVLMGSDLLDTSSTDYVPLEKSLKEVWLEVTQYDQDDALFNTVYLWCHIKVSGDVKFSDKHVTASWEAKKLISTLNTGTLA